MLASIALSIVILCAGGLAWVTLDNWSREKRGIALHRHVYSVGIMHDIPYWRCTKNGCTKTKVGKVYWPFERLE